jgi:hypothetical protein
MLGKDEMQAFPEEDMVVDDEDFQLRHILFLDFSGFSSLLTLESLPLFFFLDQSKPVQ